MANKVILIVDDDRDLRRMLTMILERRGFEPVVAASGEEALGKFAVARPDLVLLDLAMPGMNGFEVAAAIRSREAEDAERGRTPIVILTAYAQRYFADLSVNKDVDAYITKPVSPNALVIRLQQFLRV